MIQYYKIDFGDTVRYFARALGVPDIAYGTEWRLSGDDATEWVRLHGAPVLGWMLDGDTSLDEIDASQVPVPLTPSTIAAA